MKKPIKYIIFAIFAAFLGVENTFAEFLPKAPEKTAVFVSTQTTEVEVIKELPLTARKAKAEADLLDLYTQLSLFTARTQIAIDRLNMKGIESSTSENELALSFLSLGTAKTNLDLFSEIKITDDATEEEITNLKKALKSIEDDLNLSKEHLIKSLIALKAAISVSIDTK